MEEGIQEVRVDLYTSTVPPEKQETVSAIKVLKNGKASRQDKLNAKLFKVDLELAAEILKPLFTAVWEGNKVPDICQNSQERCLQ